MALLSTKINDLCLNDGDASLKESLMCNVPIPQRNVPDNVIISKEGDASLSQDVVLLCGANQHQILANRDVLSSKVPSLIEMIETNNNESKIHLPDLEASAAEALVNFVYTSELDLTPDIVLDFASAAEKLGMNEILNRCQEYIQQNVLADSWLFARQIALERRSKWLLTTVDDYIFQNFSALLQSTDFLQLSRLQVEIINRKDDARNENEICDEILGLVVEWCKVKLEQEDLLEGLMEHTHLVCLTTDSILKDCKKSDFEEEEDSITDAQKEYIRQKTDEKQTSPSRSPRRPRSLSYTWMKEHSRKKALKFSKPSIPGSEYQFKLLAGTAVSDGCYVGVAVIASEVVCISAYCNEQTPSCSSSVSSDSSSADDLGLSLIKPMIRGRCSVGVAEVNNRVYAVGGYDRGHCLNLVECYDQERNEWVPTSSLSCPRGRLGLSCLNGKLYAIGGSSGNSELKSGECFDPETRDWSKISDMSICRSNFDVCVLDGKLFAIGGTDGRHSVDSVEAYDPEKNVWSNMPPMEIGRDGVCAQAMNGHLYACGGYNVWHCLDSVERYNPKENHWSMVTSLNTARRGAGAIVLNNKLYVIGGTDGSNILKTVECYSSVTDTWSYVASMNSCRHNVGVTVMNGYIFAVGGFDGVAFLNTSEFYDPELDKWCAFTQV